MIEFTQKEAKSFKDFWEQRVNQKEVFQDWQYYAHQLVTHNQIDSEKIRMALRSSPVEAMIIIGMPNALTYKEENDIAVVGFLTVGCKNQSEKKEVEKEIVAANMENVVLNISGMTCEIGCAKFIQSKLTKQEGVINATVIFKDSIANVKFDANKTSKKDLIAMVDGLADGKLYKATETKTVVAHKCDETCKEKCEMKSGETACKEDCKMDCCKDKKV